MYLFEIMQKYDKNRWKADKEVDNDEKRDI